MKFFAKRRKNLKPKAKCYGFAYWSRFKVPLLGIAHADKLCQGQCIAQRGHQRFTPTKPVAYDSLWRYFKYIGVVWSNNKMGGVNSKDFVKKHYYEPISKCCSVTTSWSILLRTKVGCANLPLAAAGNYDGDRKGWTLSAENKCSGRSKGLHLSATCKTWLAQSSAAIGSTINWM